MARKMPVQKMTATYAAGFVDGEGCVRISKHRSNSSRKGYRFCPCVSVTNTNRKILVDLKKFTGGLGSIRPKTMNHSNRKQGYEWQMWSKEAAFFLWLLVKHLRIKQAQALLVIKFVTAYGRRVGRGGLSKEDRREQERLYRLVRHLNKRGV